VRSVFGRDLILVLPFGKSDEGDGVGFGEALDGGDGVSGEGTQESGGSDGLAPMPTKEHE